MKSAIVSAMALCLTVQLHSQVRGHVRDESGAPIPGATVILKSSPADKEIARIVTNDNGAYSFNSGPGQYSIEASAECFMTARYRSPYTMSGRIQRFEIVLRIANCGGDFIEIPGPPPLDVCDVISDLAKYRNKIVEIRGEFIVSDHGAVLTRDKCPQPLITSGHVWPTMISLEPSPNPESCRQTMGIARPGTQFWVTVVGRLETREHLEMVRRSNGKTMPIGYGHLNAYPAQLVYKQMKACTVFNGVHP